MTERKRKKAMLQRIVCLYLCAAIIITGVPVSSNAASRQKKFIEVTSKVFAPSQGESTKVSFNLENKHVVNVMIMDGEEVIAYLVKDKEYEGKYKVHELTWNGKDINGAYAESGTYKVVVEPQEKKYKKFKSIGTVSVINSNSQDISVAPNVNGSIFMIYGQEGKAQGVSKVTLSIMKNGKAVKEVQTTVTDHLWYAELPMESYSLYNISASISGSSGTSTKKISAVRHSFRVTDRMEYLASAYYGNYAKDTAILANNGLTGAYTNSGELVGKSMLILNPTVTLKQELVSNAVLTNQHLGVIDQLQRTASTNPVSLSMGNNFYANQDLYIEGAMPLSFSRVYNSMSESFHEFGINWSHTYTYLLQDMGDTVAIQFDDGHIEYYTKSSDGSYEPPEGMARTLVKNTNGSYMLTVDGIQKFNFTATGRIKTIEDLNGNRITFTYYNGMLTKVETISGYFTLTYNTDGTIQKVEDSGGRSIQYGYTNGLVTSFTDAASNKTTYYYDTYNRLIKVVSPEKITLYEITYDDTNRVTKKSVQGSTYKYSYDDTNRTIECTEPNGNVITFHYTSDYRIESEEYSDGTIKYYYPENTNGTTHKNTVAGNNGVVSNVSSNVISTSSVENNTKENNPKDDKANNDNTKADITKASNTKADSSLDNLKQASLTDMKTSGTAKKLSLSADEEQVTKLFSITNGNNATTSNVLELKTYNMNRATGTMTNNTLYPQFRIKNVSGSAIELSDVTLRYYYTIDGEMPQNFWCDWSSIGAGNVTGKFVKLKTPITGADYYLEVGFTKGAGKLEPGNSVDLHTRIGKSDWSLFLPGDDYSQNLSTAICSFDQVDMFYKGTLVWGKGSVSGEGTDPNYGGNNPGKPNTPPGGNSGGNSWEDTEDEIIPSGIDKLKLQMYNTGNSGTVSNTIHPMMRLVNTGTTMVKLGDVTIRYYYTADDTKPQNFWCDWSQVGQGNITGSFHTLDKTFEGADSYLEIGFEEGAGYIDIASSIDLHVRFAKNDWTNYDITNDHSIHPGDSFKDWDKVDVFIGGKKVWGEDLTPAEPVEEEEYVDYADMTYTPVRAEMYNANREAKSNSISPRFRIYNTGNEDIKLSDIKINYFYTADGPEPQIFSADWVGIGNVFHTYISSRDVTCDFTEVGENNTKTICIANIRFSREDIFLKPGDYLELHVRINRPNWTKYLQSNDYSLNTDSNTYEEWNKIAVFIDDRWAFGSMPITYAELIDPDPKKENEYPVDSKGSYGTGTDKTGNETYYTYDEKGNITSSVDALGNKTTTTYNEWNQITSVTDELGNTTLYEYDSKGNLTSVTDAMGYETTYEYSGKGYLTKVTYADGSTRTGTYDSKGNLLTVTDGNGDTVTFDYDALNRLTKYTDGKGNTTKYTYTATGQITKITDALGFSTSTTYNGDGQVKKEIDENGNSTFYQYSKTTGLLTQSTDALSNTTEYQYDNMRNLTVRTAADGGKTTYTYDMLGNVKSVTDACGGVTSYTYDASGNVTEEKDALGNTTTYTYDKLNRVTSKTDALHYTITYEYDALGRVIKEKGATSGITKYQYDKNGNLIATTDALGNITKNEYNSIGLLKSSTDALGYKTSYEYDKEGRQTKVTTPKGAVSLWEYDANGNVVKYTDANGNVTSYTYDKRNQQTSVTDAFGHKISYQYDGIGNLTTETDALGNTTKYSYDAGNNLVKATDALGKVTSYEYNSSNLLAKETDALGNVTSYTYDKNGNKTKVTNALGYSTSYRYDACGQLLEESNDKGNKISYTYDGNGNRTSKTDANGNKTSYEYDENGNLTKVTDALGHKVNYTYDSLGNLTEETRVGVLSSDNQKTKYEYDRNGHMTKLTDPAGASISYEYDAEGNLVKEIQKDGSPTTYQYDKAGNIKKITYSDGRNTTYIYDDNSRVTSMTDWNGTTNYTYDAIGNVTSVTDAKNQKLEYTWTKLGQKKSITYPNGKVVKYTYDANGNLTKVTDTAAGVTTYTYDVLNQVANKTLPNGASSTYTYDNVGLLTQRKEKSGSAVNDTFTYQYDKNGNRTKETKVTNTGTETTVYTYDGINQLTTVTDQNGTRTYRFDEFNNRIRKEETGKDPITYSYNNMNQLIEEKHGSDVITYNYDMLGNLLETNENGITAKVYEFDSTNKLAKVITTDAISEFSYDGNGNRIRKKVTKVGVVTSRIDYVVDEESTYQNIIMAKDSISSSESCFTFGNEQVSVETDGNISYYRTDEQNSITQMLSKTGTVQADIHYDEYGVIINPEDVNINGNIFAYTGHVYDESTGLTYAKARYYDARVGRFISEDSYRGEMTVPSSLNLYAYALNNPVKYTDPSGNFAIADDALILLVLITGELLLVSYEYFNSAAGQNLINEGAVAFYNGNVLAGKVVTFTYSYFVLKAVQEIKWCSQSINKVMDVLGSLFGSKTISKGKSAKIVNGAKLNSEFWETRTISKTEGAEKTKEKSKDKTVTGKDCDKVDDKYLKKKGVDAHELKEDNLSDNAKISEYDIYVNKSTKELYIFKKGGQGIGTPTGVYLK